MLRSASSQLRSAPSRRPNDDRPPWGFLGDLARHDSVFWRRALGFGATKGPEPFVRYAPAVFGLAAAAVLPAHRRAILDNLRLVYGPRDPWIERLDVARTFTTFAACLTDAFIVGSDRGQALRGLCVGDDRYARARAMGRGVVVVTAHTGGWQTAGLLLQSVHEADVLVVMQRERDARAQAFQDEARERAGIRVVHVGPDPLDALTLLGHLRRGGVVAVQIDRLPTGMRGRKTTFFGRPWLVPEGPLTLASLAGAPVVPVFTRRRGFMEYEISISEPLVLPRRPSERQMDAAAQVLADEMQRFVSANPTQWFHFEPD